MPLSQKTKDRLRNLLVYGAPLAAVGTLVGWVLRAQDYAAYSDAVSQGWGAPAANIWGPAFLGGRSGDFDRAVGTPTGGTASCDDGFAIGGSPPPHGGFVQSPPGCWKLNPSGGTPCVGSQRKCPDGTCVCPSCPCRSGTTNLFGL